MLLKQLITENLVTDTDGSLKSGYGLIGWHNEDIDTVRVYLDKKAFLKEVAHAYLEFMEEHGDMDISQLHDDPEVAEKLRKEQAKKSKKKMPPDPRKMTSIDQFMNLPMWSDFCEEQAIVDKFE